MSEKEQTNPYKTLGARLKRMRLGHKESLAEVSGAVEIEIDSLSQMELGQNRPSQDILLLLISHFALKEDEAVKLWKMAGYKDNDLPGFENQGTLADPIVGQPMMVVMPLDTRIIYTDMVHANVNNYGVVLSFMQNTGQGNQPLAVSRLGMSREHAKSLMEVLQRTLSQSEPKILPAPSTDDQNL